MHKPVVVAAPLIDANETKWEKKNNAWNVIFDLSVVFVRDARRQTLNKQQLTVGTIFALQCLKHFHFQTTTTKNSDQKNSTHLGTLKMPTINKCSKTFFFFFFDEIESDETQGKNWNCMTFRMTKNKFSEKKKLLTFPAHFDKHTHIGTVNVLNSNYSIFNFIPSDRL